MSSLAHFIYVAEGFMEDCDMLIHSLTDKYEKVDWQKFCEHWKELQFDILFYGRLSGAELVELTEECFQCARLYMVTETDNYEDQVIGIFIAYAISMVQPYSNLCSLRLTPEDVAPLKKVEAIARKDHRTDVLLILGRLYIYSTHCHVSSRERSMDYGIRKYYDDTIRVPKTIHKQWHGELNRTNIRNWEKISEMEKKYMKSKSLCNSIASATYPGTQILLDTAVPIADEISDSLRKLILGPKKENEKDEESSVSQLKQKAMMNVVNPMRHLIGIDARSATAASTRADSPVNMHPKITPKSVRTKIKENSQNVIVGKSIKQYTRPVNKAEPKIKGPSLNQLPSFCDDVVQEPNSTVTRVDTPEQPFRGFTAEEIELTNASLSNSDIDISPIKKTKMRRQNGKETPKSIPKTSNLDFADLEDSNNIQKRKNKVKKLTSKLKKIKTETKKRKAPSPKKTVKNKKNYRSKLTTESESSDGSSIDFSSIDNIHVGCDPNTEEKTETCKTEDKILTQESKDVKKLIQYKDNRQLTEETNAVARDFVQYKVDDIIIHAEPGLPDLEIELIDQYNGPVNNDVTEHIPETAVDGDISELGVPENMGEKVPMDTADGSEETVEVVRILSESEAAVIETRESLVVPRRKRKRPSLQSKLRRMGILPVANFYNEEANDS